MSTNETQPVVVTPNCCDFGVQYIRKHAADLMDGPDHDGWAICLLKGETFFRENVKWCPWCGKDIR